MKTYTVRIYYSAYTLHEVEAKNEEGAIKKAREEDQDSCADLEDINSTLESMEDLDEAEENKN